MSVTLWRLARSVGGSDVVHVHDPELLLVVAVVRPFLRDVRWVYDAHEDYSEQLRSKPWLPHRLRRPMSRWLGACEVAVANRCDLVVAATPSIARRFRPDRTVVVQNFPDLTALPPPSPAADSGEFRVMHLGEMNERRGASSLISALAELPDSSRVVVEQMGPVKPRDVLAGAATRIRIVPPADHQTALGRLAASDAGLVLFRPGPNHDFSQPNKLFEYLVAGLPVLASDIAHWRSIVAACGATAVFVDPDDPSSVREGLVELERVAVRHDRALQAEHARALYSWDSQAEVLKQAYEGLAAGIGCREG